MTIQKLRQLIQHTHEHGLRIRRELIVLDKHGHAKGPKARGLRLLLRGLEALNRRRRQELWILEHPHPKPRPGKFTMFDAIEFRTAGIPTAHPTAVAGYVDGKWADFGEAVRRYPGAKHLSIAVFRSGRARSADIEQGDMTPWDAPDWFHGGFEPAFAGDKPRFYGSEEPMVATHERLLAAGIKRWQYLEWKADYAGIGPFIAPGSDATQYANVEAAGRNYDVSLCEPWFL